MPDTRHLDALAEAITQERPLVLFLGQSAWEMGDGGDPVLNSALRYFERDITSSAGKGYGALLMEAAFEAGCYDWLAGEFDKQATPEWFAKIASLPLGAVFTSSINSSLAKRLRNQGRSVEVVLSKEDNPLAPRSRKSLNITHLFGRAGEQSANEAPPRNRQQLLIRMGIHGTTLLGRILETTTPLGVLLVDGYRVNQDWLAADSLAAIIAAFAPKQVLWFGWDESRIGEDTLLGSLACPGGPIIPIRERLVTALSALELDHRIDLSIGHEFLGEEVISLRESFIELSPETRFKTSAGATIIDDSFLAPVSPLGKDAEYAEFRKFHGYCDNATRLIEGVRRGFAFKRSCEKDLHDKVTNALSIAGRFHKPILVHGQSGSGKSLVLAMLALAIRQEKEFPVLFASRVTRVPRVDELEDFCHSVEMAGANATLLVCDANAPEAHYRELVRGFVSRGRRVVVVGSVYRQVDREAQDLFVLDTNLLEIKIGLDDEERSSLNLLLEHYVGACASQLEPEYLLPILYRVLPEVRPRLAAGLAGEALNAEDHLRCQGRSIAKGVRPVGELGRALAEAGYISVHTLLDEKVEEFLVGKADSAARIIDYVMMAGKLGCGVPINLLMRAVGGGRDLVDVANLFIGVDIFRWVKNDDDEILICPRLRLEAELIASRRLGNARAEIEIVMSLLANASPSAYNSSEMRFVLDIIHRIGPDGPYGVRYSQGYLDIARVLTDLRVRRGVVDPRLMLQESTLRRKYLRDSNGVSSEEHVKILEEAREIIDSAITAFGGSRSPGLRRSNAHLVVERAAIYGYRAVQILCKGASLDEVWQYYDAARDAVRQAVLSDDEYFATDINLWVPSKLLERGDWDQERRGELIADIWDALDRVDVNAVEGIYKEKFEERRVKVAQALRDNELEESALKQLEDCGSLAGYYLKARGIAHELFGSGIASSNDVRNATNAACFLEKHLDIISTDARCLRYLLKCQWIKYTGFYLFGEDRSPIPSDDRNLNQILDLLDRLERAEGAHADPKTRYLKAVLLWRLKREREARDIWQELSRETQYNDPRRIIRQHIWTGSSGRPQIFHGRLVKDTSVPGRYRVQVEDLRQEVELLEQDFRGLELRRGMSVPGGFHIVFNYIGPLAERVERKGRSR